MSADRILLSGGSGLIGTRFRQSADPRQVTRLVRTTASDDGEVRWSLDDDEIGDVSNFDAVVHLAGENIAKRRWTRARKRRIRDSRVQGTTLLARALATAEHRPRVLVCASATGIYGDRDDETLTESSQRGTGYLADVTAEWEAAANAAERAGIRVVHLRLGIVLAKQGGALGAMLRPFRLGAGGVIGSGDQFWSWVDLEDVIRAIWFSIQHGELSGPYNLVAPQPATNREFTRALGRVLRRPTLFPMPAPIAKLLLGEMAGPLLLASTRVLPSRLLAAGFEFEHTELEATLRSALAQPGQEHQ